jgi:uncharacterized protein (DUF2235 family)
MAGGKRIALFLDGTWNTVNDNTNVYRMKSLCVAAADQLRYYSAGVGTQYGERLIGGMFGYGLDAEVIQAYEWLIEHFVHGDQVFLFGFSRGAYTARSLAGFISKCGMLTVGAPLSLKQLYDRYKRGSVPFSILHLQTMPDEDLQLEDRWLKKYSQPIPIWFQGVWDTVGGLGVPFGHIPLVSRANYGWLETDLRINDTHAFHALAIDEHREAFAPTLWKKTEVEGEASYPPRTLEAVEQRWFVGAHADVGGGYPDGLLAQVPLLWLMQKAKTHGLVFKSDIAIDGDENQATIHDSFKDMAAGIYRAYKLFRPYHRAIGAAPQVSGPATTAIINETIDGSVFDRWRNLPGYRPQNLLRWARMRDVDPALLQGPVLASDGTSFDAGCSSAQSDGVPNATIIHG